MIPSIKRKATRIAKQMGTTDPDRIAASQFYYHNMTTTCAKSRHTHKDC